MTIAIIDSVAHKRESAAKVVKVLRSFFFFWQVLPKSLKDGFHEPTKDQICKLSCKLTFHFEGIPKYQKLHRFFHDTVFALVKYFEGTLFSTPACITVIYHYVFIVVKISNKLSWFKHEYSDQKAQHEPYSMPVRALCLHL